MWLNELSSGKLYFVDGKARLDLIFDDGHHTYLSDVDYFEIKEGHFYSDEVNSGPSGPYGGKLTSDFSGIKFEGKNIERWNRDFRLKSKKVRSIFDDWKVSIEEFS